MQQSTAYLLFNTVLAARMGATVRGSLLSCCGCKALSEAAEISWLSGRLSVGCCVVDGTKRLFVRALCLCHNDRFRNLNHSIP
jgi:hypothetical protein